MATAPDLAELYPQLVVVAAVAASHMSLPHHWLPYSIVGRAHGWSLRSILALTFLGALGHVSATLLLTLAISGLSGTLVSDAVYRHLSSLALVLFGFYYLYTYFVARRRDSCCEPSSDLTSGKPTPSLSSTVDASDSPAVHRAAATSLLLLTTLSPCVGSMPILLAVLAPPVALATVFAAAAVMLAASAGIMVGLVAVSYVGAKTLDFARVRRHERGILGIALVLLAFCTFFVFSEHHHHHHHQHHTDVMGSGVTHAANVHEGHQPHEMAHQTYPVVGHDHDHAHDGHSKHGHDDGSIDDRVLRTATLDGDDTTRL